MLVINGICLGIIALNGTGGALSARTRKTRERVVFPWFFAVLKRQKASKKALIGIWFQYMFGRAKKQPPG
ncbi:hypothetical protein [Roseibium sp.]|uniref:hypothetical protein n=1 Tax=Roseibium sp. TaxID=1936156 RepID=UPI00263410E3|nr:hypothetical protein [Roseibium sp.]